MALIIRRLRCDNCRRINHELPDILVPYKRHVLEIIEATVTGETTLCVTADETTLWRWRQWFLGKADYFLGCLEKKDTGTVLLSVSEGCFFLEHFDPKAF